MALYNYLGFPRADVEQALIGSVEMGYTVSQTLVHRQLRNLLETGLRTVLGSMRNARKQRLFGQGAC